jgi:predicted DNA-binding transcriptional regulator YafY
MFYPNSVTEDVNTVKTKSSMKKNKAPKAMVAPVVKVKNFKAANTNSPKAIRFFYTNNKNEAGVRTVVPQSINNKRILGLDLDKNEIRSFSLTKIKAFL